MEHFNFTELEHLFYSVMHLHHKRMHMLLEDSGTHPKQPMALFVINKNNGSNQREIAELLRIKPASITVMLQRMEKTGMVIRKQDENDQRIIRVYITEKGKEELALGMEVTKILNDEAFGNLSEEDKSKMCEILAVVNKNLSDRCENHNCKNHNCKKNDRSDESKC